jgi:ubiquinone/menaquinone biosynthesis C-methylase UbiE
MAGANMSLPPNKLSTSDPWDLVANGYSETTMQILAQYAETAIAHAKLKPGATVLDVACGPGTLALMAAKEGRFVHGIDFSGEMISIFKQRADSAGLSNIGFHHGDAQELPYPDGMFDAAFSMFGLMFFPDRRKGFSEIHRTLKPGGSVCVTSWGPANQSPAMSRIFGALRAIKPDLPEPQRMVESLENPEVFERELREAGFADVKITCVTKPFPVESIEAFWDYLVRGSAPIMMLKNSMGDDVWREREKLAIKYLEENIPSTPTTLTSDAWLGFGLK